MYLIGSLFYTLHINLCTLTLLPESLKRLAKGWMGSGSNPGGGNIFCIRPDWPCVTPSLLYTGYWVIPGGRAKAAGV